MYSLLSCARTKESAQQHQARSTQSFNKNHLLRSSFDPSDSPSRESRVSTSPLHARSYSFAIATPMGQMSHCLSLPKTPLAFQTSILPVRSFRATTTSTRVMACATRTPILVSDVLGTLVRDPFYHDMASYFGFDNLGQFVAAKTPRLWVDFELGKIDETYLARHFFKDHRPVNLDSFKHFLQQSYQFLPGIPDMLTALRHAQVEVHLCTNYPTWASLIEDSLHLASRFGVKWTFVSGAEGVRKPDKRAYRIVASKAHVSLSDCILLDDRQENCDGALDAGFLASVHFENALQASGEIKQLYLNNSIPLRL